MGGEHGPPRSRQEVWGEGRARGRWGGEGVRADKVLSAVASSSPNSRHACGQNVRVSGGLRCHPIRGDARRRIHGFEQKLTAVPKHRPPPRTNVAVRRRSLAFLRRRHPHGASGGWSCLMLLVSHLGRRGRPRFPDSPSLWAKELRQSSRKAEKNTQLAPWKRSERQRKESCCRLTPSSTGRPIVAQPSPGSSCMQ